MTQNRSSSNNTIDPSTPKASSSSNRSRTPTATQKSSTSLDDKDPKTMETDQDKKTEPTSFTSYRLLSAYDPKSKNNILKFAPSSNRKIDLTSFVQPIKLNRKDPWAIRKKAEEEKLLINKIKLDAENAAKVEDDQMKIDQDTKPANKPTRDDTLIAPAPASQPKVRNQPFKKKTKQVFIATDQAARALKKEEYQSWLLEDASTNGERWVGRYESAGASSGLSGSGSTTSTLKTTGKINNDASNYVLFRMDGSASDFQVLPCHRFYRFTQRPNYDTLGADEAEAAYEKMQKPTTKEDVGRWFMRRRGANDQGKNISNLTNLPNGIKGEPNVGSSSFFDESKISFGSQNKIRSQVEIPSFINGRRNKFTAVQGSNSNHDDDDDEDRKPKFGQEGEFDEVDYTEKFDDDEEGAGNLNDEAMEEDELKELEEKMSREMLAAGKAGDDERDKDDMDIEKDDMFGEREDLTKEGKAVKKLLMRKGEDNVYESDDDVRNPYASEEDESDFEEVVPTAAPVGSPLDANKSTSRSGTPAPGAQNNSSGGLRTVTKPSLTQPTTHKHENSQSRPPSRSGTPTVSSHVRATSSPHPAHGSGFNGASLSHSRGTSPPLAPSALQASKASQSRAASPVLSSVKPAHSTSAGSSLTVNGKRKQHPTNMSATNEKRMNAGPGAEKRSSFSSTADHGPSGLITKQEIINLLKSRSLTTKELLSCFKVRLKEEERNKSELFAIIRDVAQIVAGRLILKDGL